MKILAVVGTRPNFVKMAPLMREFSRSTRISAKLVHTGQHYDRAMSELFFEQLNLPEPDCYLGVQPGSHARQTADIMTQFEELCVCDSPDLVLVVGDVNSTLATALTAGKLCIPIAHVEAGLRSFDMSMPEEINRLLVDRLARFLFVSEPAGMANLEREGLRREQKAFLVGNVMIDSLVACLPAIKAAEASRKLGLQDKGYAVMTVHRPSNVDSEEGLLRILEILEQVCKTFPVVFPVHPRTGANLRRLGLLERFGALQRVMMTEPLGYLEFLSIVSNAACVLTDSGGLQQETTWLGIPCITLRENTELPVTTTQGTNVLTGLSLEEVRAALRGTLSFDSAAYKPPELWDGHASERITEILLNSCDA
ncbi:MAG TPA: UDP-N-acetylglucosamine 2-epimerase (non-hydrolyzing) [Candidatus Hydrogenedentes bacterium]|nr:UDP-N-acetylglucosamine 2-epimerase (non-hydrolyzing) [Candidatus Hydrogenedentota bacterium]